MASVLSTFVPLPFSILPKKLSQDSIVLKSYYPATVLKIQKLLVLWLLRAIFKGRLVFVHLVHKEQISLFLRSQNVKPYAARFVSCC